MGRNGSGVRAISESSVEIAFTFRGTRCRERIRVTPTPANLKRIERHRCAILDAIERGTFDYAVTFPDSPRRHLFAEQKGSGTTLRKYLDGWIEKQQKHLKTSTFHDYEKTTAILSRDLGDHELPDLKRNVIREWCDKQTCGNKRLANLQSVLRSALNDAVNEELIEANPMIGWLYERKEAPKRVDDVDPFTAAEQKLILAKLTGQGANLIQFAIWSGLRTSELVALEWGDIDWQRGFIRVSRAKTQAGDEHEDTKTKAGKRDVKLLPPALEALIAQKAWTLTIGKEVFHNPRTNEPWTGDQPIRKTLWEPALRKAKVRYRRPYQTRHTYASMMLSAGESPMWVAQQMGHADWGMIRRVYGRFIPDSIPDAGNKAVAMFMDGGTIPAPGIEQKTGTK